MRICVAVLAVTLLAAADAAAQMSCPTTTVAFGTDQSGAVESSDCSLAPHWNGVGDSWAFALIAGDLVTFQLLRGTLRDPHALVVSPAGVVIAATNDYFDGDRQSFLSVQASASGVYRILITSGIQGGIDYGTYVLRSRAITTPTAPYLQSATVDYGQFRAAWYAPLSPTPVLEYQLDISTAPGKQDIGVVSVAPAGNYTVYLATLVHGYYFVRVRARNSYGWGAYSSEIETYITPLLPRASCPSNPLRIGITQYGVIEASDCPLRPLWTGVGDEWTFYLNAGGQASFELLPGTMADPFALVLNPSGNVVQITNGFINGKRNRRFGALADAAGLHRVIVTSPQDRPHFGSYVLRSGAIDAPAQPYLDSLSIENGQLTASWSSPLWPTPIVEYQLEIGTSSGARDVGVFFEPGSPLIESHVRRVAVGPGVYFVRVRGRNGQGWSEPSNELQIRITSLFPNPPCCLSAVVRGRQVELSWLLSAGDPVAFVEVIAARSPGARDLGSLNVGNVTSARFDEVPPGVYYVRVRAWNQQGPGSDSNEVAIQVGPALPPPPQNLIATVIERRVRLTWSAPQFGDVAFYEVLAGSAPGLADVGTLIVGANTSIEVPNVPPGRYHVRIRAWNGVGAGPASQEMTIDVQ